MAVDLVCGENLDSNDGPSSGDQVWSGQSWITSSKLKNVVQGKMEWCERLWQSHVHKYLIKLHIKITEMELEINHSNNWLAVNYSDSKVYNVNFTMTILM